MSSVNSPYGSNARITGMFSGLDTDALVQNMCSGQQSKIDKQAQKKTAFEWRNEAIESVLDDVKEFSNTYCSALGTSSMLKSSTYSAYKVTSAGTSGSVLLTASSGALAGDYKVRVLRLAQNAAVSSADKVSPDGKGISAANTTALGELSFKNPLQFDSAGNLSFSINGKAFTFNRGTSLQSMLNTINSDPSANVTMKYSRLSDTFSITANAGGVDSLVSIMNTSGNAFGTDGAFQIDTGMVKNGCNSLAEINGVTIEQDTNEYSEDGITFKLLTESDEYMNFFVSRDYSATTDAARTFVDALNTLLSKLGDLAGAKNLSSSYPPLTEAQKKEMSEEQIKAWEEKAKTGLLRYDSDLQRLISGLKNSFFSPAGGTGKSAPSIGISSGAYFTSDKGKLMLDTDVLEAALRENPEQVIQIFTGGGSTAAGPEQGIIYKIRNQLSVYQRISSDLILNTEKKIVNIDSNIANLEDRLDALAEKYYAQFSAMETALAALNSQAEYISQLFV